MYMTQRNLCLKDYIPVESRDQLDKMAAKAFSSRPSVAKLLIFGSYTGDFLSER